MSRFPISPPSTSNRFVAALVGLLFVATACSGSSDVELNDASASVESPSETSSDETDADATTSEDTESEEVAIEADDGAMGEDDAMVDDEVDTTVPVEDVADGGSAPATDLGAADLNAALEAATSDRFSLPFMYLTVDQDCNGCAETISLYYVPSETKASILTLSSAYVDGVAQSDFSAVDPSLQAGDPRRIAEQLSGTDAEFGIDSVSGAVTSWTLDGNSVTLRCLQVDTRPVDMRTEVCENSIIG